jgi:hypothetical protein
METQSQTSEPSAPDLAPLPAGDANRGELLARLDRLIRLLDAGGGTRLSGTMHNRGWRVGIDASSVDSGQLAYADTLVDEAHSILRRPPARTAIAVEQLRRARERLA